MAIGNAAILAQAQTWLNEANGGTGNQVYWVDLEASSNLGPELFGLPIVPAAETPPAAPSNLTVTAVKTNQVDLTWVDNANNEYGFLLQRALNADFSSEVMTYSFGENTLAFSDTEVRSGTTYYYRVQVTNAAGGSAHSSTTTASTLVEIPTPTGPLGNILTATPAFTFNAVAGATGYQIYLWTNATASGDSTIWYTPAQVGAPAGSGTASITLPATLPAGTYIWQVRAKNASGAGAWSGYAHFAVGARPAAPTPSAPLGAGASATPAFTFNAVAGATGYQIYLWTNATASGDSTIWYTPAQVGAPAGSGTASITLPATLPAGTYIWQVRAKNASGAGAWSGYAHFAVGARPAAPTPSAPLGAGASATPAFTFNAVAGATGYQIYLWTNATASGDSTIWYTPAQVGAPAGSGTASITLPATLPAGTYIWQVRAKNASGTGAWSGYAHFAVGAPTP